MGSGKAAFSARWPNLGRNLCLSKCRNLTLFQNLSCSASDVGKLLKDSLGGTSEWERKSFLWGGLYKAATFSEIQNLRVDWQLC